MRPTVMVVDDNEAFRRRLARAFEARGWEATIAGTPADSLAAAAVESPEHAVVDLRMPRMGGLELARRLLQIDETTRIVLLTGYGSIATAVSAVRIGVIDYLTKPAEVDEIIRAFRKRSADEPTRFPEAVPSLARTEWEHINRVLNDCDGNITQAAKLLGIHRRSLQRKLAKYPVRR